MDEQIKYILYRISFRTSNHLTLNNMTVYIWHHYILLSNINLYLTLLLLKHLGLVRKSMKTVPISKLNCNMCTLMCQVLISRSKNGTPLSLWQKHVPIYIFCESIVTTGYDLWMCNNCNETVMTLSEYHFCSWKGTLNFRFDRYG